MWKIIGHEKELAFLEEHLRTGRVGHAYLFTGPGNIGKFTIAKTLAQMLQCPNHFCRTCPTCIQVWKGAHIDTIEIPDDGSSIKIEPIREIISRLNMTSQNPYKILLMKNIGRLTEEAGNSLLKLIEEPTGRTVFLFTAEQARDCIPTILSRVYQLKFKSPREEELRKFLHAQYPSLGDEAISQTIVLALGKPGRAIALIEQPEQLQAAHELYEKTKRFIEGKSMADRFRAVEEFVKEPETMREFLMVLVTLLRHRALHEQDPGKRARVSALVERIPGIAELIRKNVNTRLVLEHFAIQCSL